MRNFLEFLRKAAGKTLKWTAIVGAALVLIAFAAVAFLETSPGKQLLVKAIEKFANKSLTGKLNIDSIHGNFWSELTVKGLSLTDRRGVSVATVHELNTVHKISPFHRPFLTIEGLRISHPVLSRHVDAKGNSNWDQLFKPSENKTQKPDENSKEEPAVWVKNLQIENGAFRQFVQRQNTTLLKDIDVALEIPLILKRLPFGTVHVAGQYQGHPLKLVAKVQSLSGRKASHTAAISGIYKQTPFDNSESQDLQLQGRLGQSHINGAAVGLFNLESWIDSDLRAEISDFHLNTSDLATAAAGQSGKSKKSSAPTVVDGRFFADVGSRKVQCKGFMDIQENHKMASRLHWNVSAHSLPRPATLVVESFNWVSHCPLLTLNKKTTLTLIPDDFFPVGHLELKGCAGSASYHRSRGGALKASVGALQLRPLMAALGMPRQQKDKGRVDLTVHLPEGPEKSTGTLKASFALPKSLLGGESTFFVDSKFTAEKASAHIKAALGSETIVGDLNVLHPFITSGSNAWVLNNMHATATLVASANNLDLGHLYSSKIIAQPLVGQINAKLSAAGSASHAKFQLESTGANISKKTDQFGKFTPPVNYSSTLIYDGNNFDFNGTVKVAQSDKDVAFDATAHAPFLRLKDQGAAIAQKLPVKWSLRTKDFDLSPFVTTPTLPGITKDSLLLTAKANGHGTISNPEAKAEVLLQTNHGPLAQISGDMQDRQLKATIKAQDASLDGVLPLATSYATLHGSKLNADFRIAGPLTNLMYEGGINLTANEVRVPALQAAYKNAALNIEGHDTRIDVTQFSLKSGEGSLDGKGSVALSKGKDLDAVTFNADFKKFRALSNDKMLMDTTGHLKLTANRADSTFNGDITISEGQITLPEDSNKKTLEPLGDLKDVVMDDEEVVEKKESLFSELTGSVHIKAPGRFWIKGPDVAVDLSADLYAGLDEDQEVFVKGTVDTNRGFVEVFGRHLELRKGHVDLDGDYTNPRIEAQAVYNYSPRNIIVSLHGPKETLKPELLSEPQGYSEDECLGVLLTGSPNYQGGGGGGGGITGIASGFVVGQLKKKLGPKLPFDTITADLRSEDEKREEGERSTRDKKANIEIGKYISDRAFLKVGRAFATQQSQAVNMITLDYRLSTKWSFETKQTDAGRSDIGLLWTTNY